MTLHTDIYLNQLAQGLKPWDTAQQWFAGLSGEAQLNVLDRLAYFAMQAQVVGSDAEEAIRRSGLKPGFTACAVLSSNAHRDKEGSGAVRVAMRTIVGLPEAERHKSFILLLSLFAVADERRRSKRRDPDRHWWHRDLSDERVIAELLAAEVSQKDK